VFREQCAVLALKTSTSVDVDTGVPVVTAQRDSSTHLPEGFGERGLWMGSSRQNPRGAEEVGFHCGRLSHGALPSRSSYLLRPTYWVLDQTHQALHQLPSSINPLPLLNPSIPFPKNCHPTPHQSSPLHSMQRPRLRSRH